MSDFDETGPCLGRDRLQRLLDDRLDPAEAEAVEAHVEGCAGCQAELARLSASDGAAGEDAALLSRLRGLPREEAEGLGWADPAAGGRGLPMIAGFRLVREVGRGGMGVVYEAVELALGRRVALKVLLRTEIGSSTAVERFRREARAAARLHHTNLVPVFGVGEDADHLYYAMQFIDGEPLDRLVDRLRRERAAGCPVRIATPPPTAGDTATIAETAVSHPRMADPTGVVTTDPTVPRPPSPPPDPETPRDPSPGSTSTGPTWYRFVARIGLQAAEGLEFALRQGVLHRDVKPSNILIDAAGAVWVVDFGLAKAGEDGLTQTGDLLGTLRYMAPERFRGGGDARSDVYALGLTLYELLTLRPAFDSPDRLALIGQIKDADPPRPRALDPRIPLDLETVVLKAIEKAPAARYPSAGAMGDDLRRFLADEPIQARPVGAAERVRRWARRNPAVATLAGVLTAVLVAVTAASITAAAHFKDLARREMIANRMSQADRRAAEAARGEADLQRDGSRRLSATLALDRGITLAEDGAAAQGLVWMLEAYKTAPADAADLRRVALQNLGGWFGRVDRTLAIFDGGPGGDNINLSPDGRSFTRSSFTPGSGGVWETATGRRLLTIPESIGLVQGGARFSPDGTALMLAGATPTRAVAFDLASGRVRWETPPMDRPGALGFSFSPDGEIVYVSRVGYGASRSEPGEMLAFDVRTGRPRGGTYGLRGIRVLPDGRAGVGLHVDAGRHVLIIRSLPDGRMIASWPALGEPGWGSIDLSPDGKTMFQAYKSGDAFPGRLWDLATQRPIGATFEIAGSGAFLPSGDRLLTWLDGPVAVSDPRSGRPRALLGRVSALSLAPHPDGRTVLILSTDRTIRRVELAEDADPRTANPEGIADEPASPGPTPARPRLPYDARPALRSDGRLAMVWSRGPAGRAVIRNHDPATGNPVGTPASHAFDTLRGLAFSPDGRAFATGTHPDGRLAGEARLWDVATGRLLLPPMLHTNWVQALAFRPDGRVLAAGDYHGQVRFWDTATGKEASRPLAQGGIAWSLAYSPDGRTLAVGTYPRQNPASVRLWDTASGRPLADPLPHSQPVSRLRFRPDGRVLATEIPEGTWLWEVPAGRAIGGAMVGERSAAFRPDGRAFATGGKDGLVRLRDADTGELLGQVLSARSPVQSVTFRSDGGLLVAGCQDGSVRLADPSTSHAVGPPRHLTSAVVDVAFTPDGRSFVGLDASGVSRSWPVPAPLAEMDLAELTARVEARSGYRMAAGPSAAPLDVPSWRARIEQVARLDATPSNPADDGWHEAMARESEDEGRPYSASWHLDCLIAGRPRDWALYARRARARASSGEFDRAADDLERAETFGPGRQVPNFLAHRTFECASAGRWTEVLWYLDRLAAARPGDWRVFEDRAAILRRVGRHREAEADAARALALSDDAGWLVGQAERLAREGRWAEAAALHARARGLSEPGLGALYSEILSDLSAGDSGAARLRIDDLLARFGDTTDPSPANNAAWYCLIEPGAGPDRRRLAALRLAEVAYRNYPAAQRRVAANTLGAALYRAGRASDAVDRLVESLGGGEGTPQDWAFLALAHHRLGHRDEAGRWLEKLRSRVPIQDPGRFWEEVELRLLRQEAETVIRFDPAFPADPFVQTDPAPPRPPESPPPPARAKQ